MNHMETKPVLESKRLKERLRIRLVNSTLKGKNGG